MSNGDPITITAPEPSLWFIHGDLAIELTGMPHTDRPTVTQREQAFIRALLDVARERMDETPPWVPA